jgi:eukaryotic-like serine/threonine-protein kinase
VAQSLILERYRYVSRLGAGGSSTVLLAEDTLLGRRVALKRMHASDDVAGRSRLRREALVGASLSHPNLVSIFDIVTTDEGEDVIVMEYVEGETLADLIRSHGAVPPADALPVLDGLAAALDAIHEQGIVHRDVKPANVLLGSEGAIKLADLGVADVADRTRITTSGAVVGSYSYMAPEQLDGSPPSAAMDIYALAALGYELLSGEKARPQSNPLALAHAIATQPPPDLRKVRPHTPAIAAAVLQRGMSADPARRPRSAGELVARLRGAFEASHPTQAIAKVEPIPQASASPPPPSRPIRERPGVLQPGSRRRRTALLVPALLVAAAVAAAVVIVAQLSGGSSGPHSPSARASSRTRSAGSTSSGTPRPGSTSSGTPRAGSTSSLTRGASSSSTRGGSGASASSPPAPTLGTGQPSSPSAVVQSFYEDAAAHQYGTAWALADPNMRNELGGYSAFQNQMSSVRSITFHRIQVTNASANSATVALQTTSVQTNATQQCGGTAQAVKSGGTWLLDGISIHCS